MIPLETRLMQQLLTLKYRNSSKSIYYYTSPTRTWSQHCSDRSHVFDNYKCPILQWNNESQKLIITNYYHALMHIH